MFGNHGIFAPAEVSVGWLVSNMQSAMFSSGRVSSALDRRFSQATSLGGSGRKGSYLSAGHE